MEFKRQEELRIAEERQRRQQNSLGASPLLRASDLNITYDTTPPMFGGQGGAYPMPPRTLPPQPYLSASSLEQHQNSLAWQQAPPMTYPSQLSQMGSQAPIPSTLAPAAPPPTVDQPVAVPTRLYGPSQTEVQRMMAQITSPTAGARVQVVNYDLKLEPKRLSFNMDRGKIGLFDVVQGSDGNPQVGVLNATFLVKELQCITRGISPSVMEMPPPPELSLGFRFSGSESPETKDRSEDRFLCCVFESPDQALLVAEAISQLCGVVVAPA